MAPPTSAWVAKLASCSLAFQESWNKIISNAGSHINHSHNYYYWFFSQANCAPPLEHTRAAGSFSASSLPIKPLPSNSQLNYSTNPSSPFFLDTSSLMAPSAHRYFLASAAYLSLILFSIPSLAFRPLQVSDDKAATSAGGAEFIKTEFIKTSCSSTTYPDLCFSSLYSYAGSINGSPMLLAHTALSISLDGARSASTAMKSAMWAGGRKRPMSPREEGAMKDCMENVANSISELKDSVAEMGNLRGKDVSFQINSIQTWVSAALTDDDTCMDGFAGKAMEGSGVKTAVRGRVADVAHLTSNALALVNAYASTTSQSSAAAGISSAATP